MRRRRNADASSSTDVTSDITNVPDVTVPDEATEAESRAIGNESIETSPLTAADAPAESTGEGEKKPRRRAPRRKTAEEPPADVAEAEAPVSATDETPSAETVPAEKPKRAPRRRAAKAEAVPEPEPEAAPMTEAVLAEELVDETPAPVAEITETEVAELPVTEPEILTETVSDFADDTPFEEAVGEATAFVEETDAPASEKRPRRRRSSRRGGSGGNGNGQAETTEAVAPAAETDVPEAVASTGDAEEVTASASSPSSPPKAPGTGRSSRRNRSGRQNQNAPAEPASAPSDDSGAPKRIRGLRRTAAPVTEFIAAPALAAEIVPAPAGETEEAAPKRTRGLRTRRVVPAAATLVAPTLVAEVAPQELLPPPYQPLPDEVLARLPETKIVVNKGIPELVVNGTAQLPLWFFVNTEAAEDPEVGRETAIREIRLAYESGIRFFTLPSHLPWKMRSGERRYDILDAVLQMVADNAPDAMILPRLIFSPPLSWERAHPDEMALYTDNEPGDISFASREFWEGEADETLRAAVEHIAEGAHAHRVFGFYLEHAEWLYERGRGYDVSPANEAGFRAWLKQRYKNKEVILRAAWHDGAVTFDTAEIPPFPPPPGSTLFFGPRETRWSDFHEYSSDIVAQVITRLGKAVKEASGGRSAVAVSYGYTLEINRAAAGHFALGQVLQSPNVDILTGPISYSGRTPGGAATFPAPIDSITLAGKLWVSEDDTKTHRAAGETPDTYNPKIANLEGTRAVQARNFGAALARGTGLSWMDLWGEGWLDDSEIWQGIAYLRNLAEAVTARRHNEDSAGLPEPDVAVIVDERSFFGVRNDEFLLGHLVAQQRTPFCDPGRMSGFTCSPTWRSRSSLPVRNCFCS